MRLDAFLSSRTDEISRSHFKGLIQDGHVLVNSRRVKPSWELKEGDQVDVRLPSGSEHPRRLTPQKQSLDILYEDEELLVINKAPGVVVHPGAGHQEGTLVHGLLAHCSSLATQGGPLRPGIVHRLDRDTSGAMVVAKSDRAYLRLIEQFKSHEVLKEYLALAHGKFSQKQGTIETLMDRHPGERKKMAVTLGKGRGALTRWHLEKELGEVSLLRIRITTGRTHQIRVHLSHIHRPVVGDETYGGGRRRLRSITSEQTRRVLLGVNRQLLHAFSLGFRHPVRETPLHFSAPLSRDFKEILQALEELHSIEISDRF